MIAAQHAWLAPEGASAILYRSPDHAPELAIAQATSSSALRRFGIVDVVVPDRPGAAERAKRVAATAAHELSRLLATGPDERRRVRRAATATWSSWSLPGSRAVTPVD